MTVSAALPNALKQIGESVVITAAVPAVGFAVDHTDPFFLHGRFPWLVFAPLLVALRHGFTLGLSSAAALGVVFVLAWRTRLVPMSGFPGEPIVGLVALTMIAGQFADVRQREVRRLNSGLALLRTETDRLARSHYLLEVSHDRLDEQVQRKTSSLREALGAVRALAIAEPSSSIADLGGAVMAIFAAYGGLEIGELFVVERGVLGECCASVGRPVPTRRDDPLLMQALQSRQLTYVPAATMPDRDRGSVRSPLLAAIPFVDATGTVRAVLCVQAMPFMSFDQQNLDMMVTLATSIADFACTQPTDRGAPSKLAEGARA
ncbi:MAG: Extracellular Matrix protein PelD [Labilithrix sp.]|nr:Extracellular Matrix protein PelD [Labilithrix sp.]